MARIRSFRRARPTYLLAGLALLTSVGFPLLGSPVATAAAPAPVTPGSARGDFNNDGYADLAVGVPLEDIVAENQGVVQVIYGSASGLKAKDGVLPDQLLVQNDAEGPEENDGFGLSLAVGDFNGDGFGDLAAGANGEDVGPDGDNEGSVTVFYGSKKGLVPASSQYLTEPVPTRGDQFGFTLVGGDFDGDGHDDLAVDILFKAVSGQPGAGGLLLYKGSSAGLVTTNPAQLDQDQPGTENKAEAFDQFGAALAAGDVNGDGRTDLAVGAPSEKVNGKVNAGAAHLFFGCASGVNCHLVDTATDQYLTQDRPEVEDVSEAGDYFGTALAIGDFGRGPNADLAVGISGEDVNGVADAGAVAIFYSTGAKGLTRTGNQLFTQGSGGVLDAPGINDQFGAILAVGNLGNGPQADLVVASPFDEVGTVADAGAVTILYGTSDGLSSAGNVLLTQDSPGVPGVAGTFQVFGKMAIVADFGKSAESDLAVVSRDAVKGIAAGGAVTVLYGSKTGITAAGSQYWTQDSPGVAETAELEDLFGGAYGQPGLAG